MHNSSLSQVLPIYIMNDFNIRVIISISSWAWQMNFACMNSELIATTDKYVHFIQQLYINLNIGEDNLTPI